MSTKKYQVFISSTYADLMEERRKVLNILLMADCIPSGMEAFVATDTGQFEVIKKVIDLCDYYILIIGQRYGSVNSETGLSYTEMEYDYAKNQGIPVLVFAMDESVSLPIEKKETDDSKLESLQRFKQKALNNRLATIWKTIDELIGALAVAIMSAKTEIVRPGWQRATDYDEASLRRKIMELEESNSEMEKQLNEAQNALKAFTENPIDLAFDDCKITIEYNEHTPGYSRVNRKKTTTLPELFKIISTEMMGVSISESGVENAVISQLLGSTKENSLNDNQLIKKILNQLMSLNLVSSYWSDKKTTLFWKLTEKGKKIRNDMILIRNIPAIKASN